MDRHELRFLGPLRGEGMLSASGQPLQRVHYDLQQYERVPLPGFAPPEHGKATERLIQGSVRQLNDSSLVDQAEVMLRLADGGELALRIVRLARRAYGRPVYTVCGPLP
jgi:hypothetical protein